MGTRIRSAQIQELKARAQECLREGRYAELSDLTSQIEAAERSLGFSRSPKVTSSQDVDDEMTRQRSDREREATDHALEEQAQAEAEEAALAGELSRTRAAFAAELEAGVPHGHEEELIESLKRVFSSDLASPLALDEWADLDGMSIPRFDSQPLVYSNDLALSPLSHEDTNSLRRAVTSAAIGDRFCADLMSARGLTSVRGLMSARTRSNPHAPLPTVSIDTPLPDGQSLLPSGRMPRIDSAGQYSMENLWGQPSILEDDLPVMQSPHDLPIHSDIPSMRPRGYSGAGTADLRLMPDKDGITATNDSNINSNASGTRTGAGFQWPPATNNHSRQAQGPAGAPARRVSTVAPHASKPSLPANRKAGKKQRKKRVIVKDPNKPKPQPWSETELARFRQMLAQEGPNNWVSKAARLGTNRTAKSLHTRWLRDEGRIVDKPRGMAAMREQALRQAAEAAAAAAAGVAQ